MTIKEEEEILLHTWSFYDGIIESFVIADGVIRRRWWLGVNWYDGKIWNFFYNFKIKFLDYFTN